MRPDDFLKWARLFPDPLLLTSGAGTILAANAAAEEELSCGGDRLAGKRLSDITADAAEHVTQCLDHWSRSEQMVAGTLAVRTADGRAVQTRCEGAALQPPASQGPGRVLVRLWIQGTPDRAFSPLNDGIAEPAGASAYPSRSAQALRDGDMQPTEVHQAAHSNEHRVPLAGGAARSVSGLASFDAPGDHLRAVGTMQELTELGATHAEFARREAYFRAMFENTSVGMISTAPDGHIVEANEAFCHLVGYSREELLRMTPGDLTHPDDLEHTPQERERLVAGVPEGVTLQKRYVRKDGGIRWVDLQARGIRDRSARLVYRVVTVVDVTERQLAMDRLRQKQERLAALLQYSSDIVSILDEQGRLIYNSPAAQRIHGFTPEEFAGLNTFDLIHPDDQANVQAAFEKIIERPEQPVSVQYRYATKGGGYVWMEAVGSNQLHNPAIRGIVANSRDITVRLHAENALKESERRMKTLLSNLSGMAYRCRNDEQWTMEYVSQGCYELTGYRSEEMLGNRDVAFGDLVVAADQSWLWEKCQRNLEGRIPCSNEYRIQAKDGTEHWVWDQACGIYEPGGRLVAIEGFITDITASKRMEQALREREENYRLLVENQTDMVIKVDTEGRFLFVSPSYCEVFGMTQEELLGRTFMPSVHEDDRAATARAMEALYHPPYACYLEQRALTRDGWRWIGWSDTAVLNRDATVIQIIGVGRDITDRKRAEEADQRSRSMLSAIWAAQSAFITGSNVGALFHDLLAALLEVTKSQYGFIGEVMHGADGQPYLKTRAITDIAWNEETRRLYQQTAGGMEFPNLLTLFGALMLTGQPVIANAPAQDLQRGGPPPGHPALNAFLGLPFFHGSEMIGMVGVANRPGGYDQDIVAFLQPVLSTCATLTVAERHLGEREAAQAQLQRLNLELEQRVQERTAQLQAANKELEAFSYSVSHDLRAPLRAIDGFSRALEEDYSERLDDQGHEHLQRVRGAAQRMSELIDDLIRLSRITRAELSMEQIDLSALAAEIVDQLCQAQPGRDVEVVLAPTPLVSGDARLLRVMLENLLSNAWKFTGRSPRARIEFGFDPRIGEGAFYLRDNGAGFDMRYADKLFGAFQRLHRHDEFEGTGIGLATVQRVLSRHGGRAWVSAKPNQGATFYFTLAASECGSQARS
jgi:PAS domain S-box-containing protein